MVQILLLSIDTDGDQDMTRRVLFPVDDSFEFMKGISSVLLKACFSSRFDLVLVRMTLPLSLQISS